MLTPQEEDTFVRLVTPLYRDKLFMESVYQCLRQERAMKTLRNPFKVTALFVLLMVAFVSGVVFFAPTNTTSTAPDGITNYVAPRLPPMTMGEMYSGD